MTTAATEMVTIEDVRRADKRIRPDALRTPLLRQFQLGRVINAELYLKAENLQRTGAFKFRGAYNTMASLVETGKPARVITSSSGNHGQAVAASGQLLGINVTVVMPKMRFRLRWTRSEGMARRSCSRAKARPTGRRRPRSWVGRREAW